MTRRGKRITLGVMVTGVAVVIGLAIAHWATVRDQVEAWHFQLTRETKTIVPGRQNERPFNYGIKKPGSLEIGRRVAFGDLANCSNLPVVFDATGNTWLQGDLPWTPNADAATLLLRSNGYRILEQRFPRRAYVVIQGAEARTIEQRKEEEFDSILDDVQRELDRDRAR